LICTDYCAKSRSNSSIRTEFGASLHRITVQVEELALQMHRHRD
jgi:hypothetical protein